jgi:hypothetical protein
LKVSRPKKEGELFICENQLDCDDIFLEKNRICRPYTSDKEYKQCLGQQCCFHAPKVERPRKEGELFICDD